ncbi:MAG: sigma-70 family RNA polymerase sigma factor [bacterium]
MSAITTTAISDILLLARILKRDQISLSELYDKFSGYLYSVILRIVREEDKAEDILQEVFMRVWDRTELYNESLGTPIVWMTRIARNLSIDKLRSKAGRMSKLEDRLKWHTDLTTDERSSNPEHHAVHADQQGYIAHALSKLPVEQLVLIECAYFQGFTQSQMAELLDIPLGTIKTRIRAGMIELRRQLESVQV